ncbi:MAG: molybdopterin-dependent oxidoreductase, partial [Candidatus Sifarchaeia archaeon]
MNKIQKIFSVLVVMIIVVVVVIVGTIPSPTTDNDDLSDFPDFFTKNEDYFVTRIGAVPNINRDTYELEITGLVDNHRSFSLVELQALNLTDLPLTIECIGNSLNGKLVSTAMWRGFNLYDLLESLGIS